MKLRRRILVYVEHCLFKKLFYSYFLDLVYGFSSLLTLSKGGVVNFSRYFTREILLQNDQNTPYLNRKIVFYISLTYVTEAESGFRFL